MHEHSFERKESSIWPLTDWSSLGDAAGLVGKDAGKLENLLTKYHRPLRAYLVAAFPTLAERAEELIQDFSQDRLLKAGWLSKADPKRGRFRQFVKASLRNYVKDRLTQEAKRPLSLQELQIDPAEEEVASQAFDLSWARTVLGDTLARMEADCRIPGRDQPRRSVIWELFLMRIVGPQLSGTKPPNYEELVRRLKISSPVDAQNMLATAKRIFIRHQQAVIAEYERSNQATRLEIEDLKAFLGTLAQKKSAV